MSKLREIHLDRFRSFFVAIAAGIPAIGMGLP